MLLSKALRITDSVTGSVTSHLPGPLAVPVHLAAAAVTWAPRQLVDLVDRDHAVDDERPVPADVPEPAAAEPAAEPAAETTAAPAADAPAEAPAEPEVVLTLDRPAEDVEPPIDVVGEALRAEAAEVPPAHVDEEHVGVEESVVYSSTSGEEV